MSKPILLIPMAGQGSRFKRVGIFTPKQLLPADGRNCLERSLDSLKNLRDFKIVFAVNDPQVEAATAQYGQENKLDFQIITVDKTNAPTETLSFMLAHAKELDENSVVYIFTMDVEIYPAFAIDTDFTSDGITYVFISSTPSYSYVGLEDGRVTTIAEKKVISTWANLGLYGFKTLKLFSETLSIVEANRQASPRETHVSDVICHLLPTHRFETRRIEGVHVFGTPSEYDFYIKYVLPHRKRKRIGLFSDHSGYMTKMRFAQALRNAGFTVTDYGAHDAIMSNYPVFAEKAVAALNNGDEDFLMGFCRTGQGVCITLNKTAPTLFATVIYDSDVIEFALSHNCSRALCFPQNIWLEKDITPIIEQLQNTHYEGGRHTDRLRQVVRDFLTPEGGCLTNKSKLSDFKGGWIIGNFTPTLVPTNVVEVAIKQIPKGAVGDGHFHKIGTEHTLFLSGMAVDNGQTYQTGDILTLYPMQRNYTHFTEESLILCVKTPSVVDDKYD